MSLSDAWEAHAAEWVAWARAPGHDSFWSVTLPALLEALPHSATATLDVGCGEGRLSRALAERGHRVVGVDQSPTLVRAAGEMPDAPPVVRADASRLPLRDDSFGLAVACMSLHDIDELDLAVQEVARVLQRGGRFVAALVHPMASAGRFVERTADAPFVIAGSYLQSSRFATRVERGGLTMTFSSHHRPLRSYFAALEHASLLTESVREVATPDEVVAADPADARWTRVPEVLVIRALKP
ncbi:MAG: class I SAM-dependent methyltransferase [Mycobacteriales bacterium]